MTGENDLSLLTPIEVDDPDEATQIANEGASVSAVQSKSDTSFRPVRMISRTNGWLGRMAARFRVLPSGGPPPVGPIQITRALVPLQVDGFGQIIEQHLDVRTPGWIRARLELQAGAQDPPFIAVGLTLLRPVPVPGFGIHRDTHTVTPSIAPFLIGRAGPAPAPSVASRRYARASRATLRDRSNK